MTELIHSKETVTRHDNKGKKENSCEMAVPRLDLGKKMPECNCQR